MCICLTFKVWHGKSIKVRKLVLFLVLLEDRCTLWKVVSHFTSWDFLLLICYIEIELKIFKQLMYTAITLVIYRLYGGWRTGFWLDTSFSDWSASLTSSTFSSHFSMEGYEFLSNPTFSIFLCMSPLQSLHTRKGNMDSLQFEKNFWKLPPAHAQLPWSTCQVLLYLWYTVKLTELEIK